MLPFFFLLSSQVLLSFFFFFLHLLFLFRISPTSPFSVTTPLRQYIYFLFIFYFLLLHLLLSDFLVSIFLRCFVVLLLGRESFCTKIHSVVGVQVCEWSLTSNKSEKVKYHINEEKIHKPVLEFYVKVWCQISLCDWKLF